MILITGGAGFIGINFIHYLQKIGLLHEVVVVDKLSYSANVSAIKKINDINFEIIDISDKESLELLFKKYSIDSVINFAAETHVDNSIKNCDIFIQSNIIGTVNLLELSKKYSIKKFLQISTDEVYGSIDTGDFDETSKLDPKNPYSASKAAAEHFVNAFNNTYQIPTLIVNCSNNYGPYQHPEKLIPKAITNLNKGKKIPLYGNGEQIRDWIFVDDSVEAIFKVYTDGKMGDRYCIGGESTITNLGLSKIILDEMSLDENWLEFIEDRPGHDQRYSTNCSKIKKELNWCPNTKLEDGIRKTIRWIDENRV